MGAASRRVLPNLLIVTYKCEDDAQFRAMIAVISPRFRIPLGILSSMTTRFMSVVPGNTWTMDNIRYEHQVYLSLLHQVHLSWFCLQ